MSLEDTESRSQHLAVHQLSYSHQLSHHSVGGYNIDRQYLTIKTNIE